MNPPRAWPALEGATPPADMAFPGSEQPGSLVSWLKRWLWTADLNLGASGPSRGLLLSLSALFLGALAYSTYAFSVSAQEEATIFFGVPPLSSSDIQGLAHPLASALLRLLVGRAWWFVGVGVLDILLYRRTTGRPYDWNAMLNLFSVSALTKFVLVPVVFSNIDGATERVMGLYAALLSHLPTLVHLHGALALGVAVAAHDFVFYWSHRWAHKVRFFWNLAHVSHHRVREVATFTVPEDPPLQLLDVTEGMGVIKLLTIPVFSKLVTSDLRGAAWGLLVAVVVDAWLATNHSPTLWWIEARVPALRWLRWILVTPGVHSLHHARAPRYNVSDGCNFGGSLTVWDRLFGTYVEPPRELPECGLFNEHADYCRTPLRFMFWPYVRMALELKRNRVRHWPAILFGSTSYNPPVAVPGSH